jgi:hypothetical protein
MQVNLHFVMLEELSDAAPCAPTDENIVARIQIIRECQPGDVDFAEPASDADLTT